MPLEGFVRERAVASIAANYEHGAISATTSASRLGLEWASVSGASDFEMRRKETGQMDESGDAYRVVLDDRLSHPASDGEAENVSTLGQRAALSIWTGLGGLRYGEPRHVHRTTRDN